MARETQISIVSSIVLHLVVLIALAGVRLYTDRSVEDEVAVAFVKQEKTIPLRRSPPARSRISLRRSTRRSEPESYVAQPNYGASAEFYVSVPEKQVFSEVEGLERGVFQGTGIQKPPIPEQERISIPMATHLLNDPHLRGVQMKPRVSEGHDLLGDVALSGAEPDISLIDAALKRYLTTIRRKIESEKKYPVAAQRSGIEGSTGVRLTILKDGTLGMAEVLESSGYRILDDAALQSVNNAAPFAPIPEVIKRERIDIEISLVFKLSWRR